MGRYHIELTEAEKVLATQIDFRARIPWSEDAHAIHKTNKEPVTALMESLIGRDAIPMQRKRYWSDPAYNTTRGKGSHRDRFASNGLTGPELYAHPHFLPYLRYFLYGPALPDQLITAFVAQVGEPDWFTSGDYPPLWALTRQLVRDYELIDHDIPEEFFKLTIDAGLDSGAARTIRGKVMTSQSRLRRR